MRMNEERRSTRDSKRPHGIAPDASPATDPMDRFLTQMLHIDQMRTERDEKRQAAEQTRREEQDARMHQRQTEQDQRMAQIMADMYGHMDRPPRPVDGPPCGPNLSLQKFQEGTDDMGAFLDTFEATATAGRWPRDQWPLFLRGSLSGAGLTAVAAMTAARQADYDAVKDELLREYHISTETFRKRVFDTPFDSAHPDGWLSHHRQNFQLWIASSPLGVEATVLMEITLKRLPKWLEAQIRNLNPRSYDEMAEAIVRHLDNQRPNGKERPRQETPFRPTPVERGPRKQGGERSQWSSGPSGGQPLARDRSQIECFRCGRRGHMRKDCHVKMESANLGWTMPGPADRPKWTREVCVDGRAVLALLDTGCTRSLIHPRCVDHKNRLGWKIPYRTASSKRVWFPAASILLEIENQSHEMAVGVSSHLTKGVDMLLGQDVPKFHDLLKAALAHESIAETVHLEITDPEQTESNVVMVTTRATKRKEDEERQETKSTQEREESLSHGLEEQGLGQIFDFDDDVFVLPAQNKPKEGPAEQQTHLEQISPHQLRSLQLADPTLENWRSQADGDGGEEFCWKDGVLYRKPYGGGKENLLVVPKCCREEVLRLVHCSPMAGHFGETRTLDTLRRMVVWPRMTMDLKEVCQACPTCQLAAPATLKRAPLHPLPIIRTPFDRIAMDIFGPLRRTRSGNKYVLVIMDYATKWPEAFPLRNITSETIIECLIEVTSRLGVPKEVLSDNGTNFVSTMMRQFCD